MALETLLVYNITSGVNTYPHSGSFTAAVSGQITIDDSNGSDGSTGTVYFIATNGAANYGPRFVSDFVLDPSLTYTFNTFNTDGAAPYSSLVTCFTTGTQIMTPRGNVLIETAEAGRSGCYL